METIGSYEAKTHWAAILKRVSLGQEIVITKRGVPVAKLIPENGRDRSEKEIADQLKKLRRNTTLGALNWKNLRDEGRA